MVPVNKPTWSIRELVATLALPSSNSRSDGVRHDPRPGLTGHRGHHFGEAGTRIVPVAGTGKKTERAAGHAAKKSAGKTRSTKADSKKAPAK